MKLIAISVATSSTGVGAMVYPFLIKLLTESMGVKGTLLILGGISLNAIPLAVLWSDPKYRSLSKYIVHTTEFDIGQSLIDETKSNGKDVPNGEEIIKDDDRVKDDSSEVQILLTAKCTCIDNDIGGQTCMDGNTKCESNMISEKGTSKFENTNVSRRAKTGSEGIVSKFIETITYKPFSVLICAYACAMPVLFTFEILYLDVLETKGLSRDNGITLIIIMNGVCIPSRIFPGLIHKIPRCSSSLGMIIGPLLFMMGIILLKLVSGSAGLY